MGTENQHFIARLDECFAKKLLENLGAGADDNVLWPHRYAKLLLISRGDGLAKRGETGRRSIVRGILFDRPDTGSTGVAGAGKGTVADLQLDDIFAICFQFSCDGKYIERPLRSKPARKSR